MAPPPAADVGGVTRTNRIVAQAGGDVDSRLLRLEPGFPVHLGNRLLADPRLVVLVHGDQRLFHRGLLVGGQREDLRLAGRLHRGERVVVLLLRDVVRILGQIGRASCRERV